MEKLTKQQQLTSNKNIFWKHSWVQKVRFCFIVTRHAIKICFLLLPFFYHVLYKQTFNVSEFWVCYVAVLQLYSFITVIIHNDFISCCFSVWLQKLLNEKTTLVQTDVKQEEPAMGSEKPNMLAKKVHRKPLKGPPFISKPEDILFKVRVVYWFCKNITSEKTLS